MKSYFVTGDGLAIPEKEKIKRLGKAFASESKVKRFFKHPVFYLLIMLLIIGLFTIRSLEKIKHVRKVQSIAILPFENFTGSSDEAYFVDMMHDAVISEISKIGNLIVESRTSTLQFRG
ncbi:MAG: hypothetical protein U5K79_21120 [Cyclobacteriaceae bacterium]|nr:hypothetical protein [Cyclobacteriaceae bacterium]